MADVVWYERGEDLSEPTPEEELDFLRRERVRWDSMPVTYRYTAVGPESGPDGALVSVEVPATEVGAWAPDRPGQRLMRQAVHLGEPVDVTDLDGEAPF